MATRTLKIKSFNQSRLDLMHEVLSQHQKGHGSRGIVALLGRGDDTHVEALGLKRDAIFRIASMTKPVAAVATLILLEDCKLRLDQPVDEFLPELKNIQVLRNPLGKIDDVVPLERPITVRDLLTFRMGTGFFMGLNADSPIQKAIQESGIVGFGEPDPTSKHSPDEWMKKFSQIPLMTQPGEQWMYNTAYSVLGVLIRRVTGKSLEAFFRERIFDPLGMKDTGFSVPSSKRARLSRCYWFDSEAQKLELYDGPENSKWANPPIFEDAAAGLVSTVDDFLAFSKMLLNFGKYGRKQILSRASIETMTSDQLTPAQKAKGGLFPNDWDYRGYGFGVFVVNQRDSISATPGQYGWDGGLGSSWRIDPKKNLIGIILTERTFDSPQLPDAIQDFWTLGYSAI